MKRSRNLEAKTPKVKSRNKYVTPIATKKGVDEETVSGATFAETASGIAAFQSLLHNQAMIDAAKKAAEEKQKAESPDPREKGSAIHIPDILKEFDKDSFIALFTETRSSVRGELLNLLAQGLAIQSAIGDSADMIRQGVSEKIELEVDGLANYLLKALDTKYIELLIKVLDISEESKSEIRTNAIEKLWARELPKQTNSVKVDGVSVAVDAVNGKSKVRSRRGSDHDDAPAERNPLSPIAVSSGRGPYGTG